MVGGGMPPPYACMLSFSKLLSRNEPGDTQRCWSATRVTVSKMPAAARRLASPFGRGAQCAHWAERAFPYRNSPLSRLRRQLSQRESQGGAFALGRFAVPHPARLRRATFPPGEGFFVRQLPRNELGSFRGRRTGAAGACPRPTKSTSLLSKLLSRNEPGDTQRWRFTTRVSGSNCQRRHAAPFVPNY